MSAFSSFFAFFARIFLAVLFVVSGWMKLTGFEGTVGYVASNGLPVPQLFAALTILVELGGGILLILGLFSRIAAFIMAGFVLLTIVLVHHFWTMTDADAAMNQLHAMKNLAIAGGLLMVTAFGPGAWAVGPGRD
ncbi:DoxX family protein [Inquilinus sp. YAF38]|uniref:DoxX family protein n=1 Tax=Inquilinus sp. YAF38 TaxID=3233084 RepID=UPI003F9081AC